MTRFCYNDTEFSVQSAGAGWDIVRTVSGGTTALVATGVFVGLAPDDVPVRARALVRAIDPVGVRTVDPDVAHPTLVGDLKIVGPDVTHPNFILWEKDSTSFPGSA